TPGVTPKPLRAESVRDTFVRYFREKHGHREVASSPVTPRADPSLLFVNAGMNQFKPLLLGTVDPRSEMAGYKRVVNSQKCLRAGGKHNDLEDVGRDLYHHTFFEMLGSWSFGDYFKEEACSMAWELLTQVYGIPEDQLYVTYFGGDAALRLSPDEETREIWRSIGVSPGRLLPFGLGDNFWEMGETGPCGPCTEIHYDHVRGRDASAQVNAADPEVLEIWNLVFMEYNREADGNLRPLPRRSVDTGLGLERLTAVLQGKRSNYDTDHFTPLLDAIRMGSGARCYRGLVGAADTESVDMAYRVLADHARALAVCIADGILPGMTGTARAVRFSSEVLHAPPGLLASLVPTVVETLGDVYPELTRDVTQIMDVINENEEAFMSSLVRGRRIINRTLERSSGAQTFPVDVAWSLYQNLGFPLDLISVMLEERGVRLDSAGLEQREREETEVRGRSEVTGRLSVHAIAELQRNGVPTTDDTPKYSYTLGSNGNYVFEPSRAQVLALCVDQSLVQEVGEGHCCSVILDRTNFYPEQGGQSPDRGYLVPDQHQDSLLPVEDVQMWAGYVAHQVTALVTLRVGEKVSLYVDESHRVGCMVHHTATHLLNYALRLVLGVHTEQRGSDVTAERLRFDFSAPVTTQQLQEVERIAQELVERNEEVHIAVVPLGQTARIPGLRAGHELYPDPVRVVSVGVAVDRLLSSGDGVSGSVELCCGTHLLQTGLIQDLVITWERQQVKGISRITAVTRDQAREAREMGRVLEQEVESLCVRAEPGATSLGDSHRMSREMVDEAVMPQWQRRELQTKLKALQRRVNTALRKLETGMAAKKVQVFLGAGGEVGTLIVDAFPVDSLSILMKVVNQICEKLPQVSVMLLSQQDSGMVFCACQVPKSLMSTLCAADWAVAVCAQMDGNAGGSSVVAQGSGTNSDLEATLKFATKYAKNKLAAQEPTVLDAQETP
uniref:Alanine--tRNA ligase n=1 Tax=Callorhinchus milii TaxID=7868 RepID=A0A4W3JGH3_CALMI